MTTLPPISCLASNVPIHSWEDVRRKAANAPFTVFYSQHTGWQIIRKDGEVHIPQSFEAEYGYLPDMGGFKWCHKYRRKQKMKEWYAHRKTSNRGSGRGFG